MGLRVAVNSIFVWFNLWSGLAQAIGLDVNSSISSPPPLPLVERYRSIENRKREHAFESEAQQLEYRVTFSNGLLYKADGKPLSSYLGTPAIYVITVQGELLISQFSRHDFFTHSTLARAESVLGAGEIIILEGRIQAINLESGHYLPGYERVAYLNAFLNFHGIEPGTYELSHRAVSNYLGSQLKCMRSLSSDLL